MRECTDHTYSGAAEVQDVLGENVHKVTQGGVLPERPKSGFFKRLTATSEIDGSRSTGLPDVLGDWSEEFVDLEDEVGHSGGVVSPGRSGGRVGCGGTRSHPASGCWLTAPVIEARDVLVHDSREYHLSRPTSVKSTWKFLQYVKTMMLSDLFYGLLVSFHGVAAGDSWQLVDWSAITPTGH